MTAPAAGAAGAAAAGAATSTASSSLSTTALTFYDLLASLSGTAAAAAVAAWDGLNPSDLLGSWSSQSLLDRLMVATAVGQQAAATSAGQYVSAALNAQGVATDAAGRVVPSSLAGVASDGRDLDDLLRSPLLGALTSLSNGKTVGEALDGGREQLRTIVSTQVADAGRTGAQVAMVAEPAVTEYVRMLTPPSCGRCAILAGKRFRVAEAFLRHPRLPMRLCERPGSRRRRG